MHTDCLPVKDSWLPHWRCSSTMGQNGLNSLSVCFSFTQAFKKIAPFRERSRQFSLGGLTIVELLISVAIILTLAASQVYENAPLRTPSISRDRNENGGLQSRPSQCVQLSEFDLRNQRTTEREIRDPGTVEVQGKNHASHRPCAGAFTCDRRGSLAFYEGENPYHL